MENQNSKISAIIKTKNSESTIYNCLESIKDLDEIIILDEHSFDDTVDFAKEYKAKVIFYNKNELQTALNQALNEAIGDWIFIVEDDEIIPLKLISQLKNYIQKPQKNKFSISFNQKTFYLNKELKSARKKSVLRFFKKDACSFLNDYSLDIKLESGKIYKLNKGFKDSGYCILKYPKNDIIRKFQEILNKNINIYKNNKKQKASIIFAPMNKFLYWYFIKLAVLEGKRGFIFAKEKYFEELIYQIMIYEKLKEDKNDI